MSRRPAKHRAPRLCSCTPIETPRTERIACPGAYTRGALRRKADFTTLVAAQDACQPREVVTTWQLIQGAAGWTQWADIPQADACAAAAGQWLDRARIQGARDPVQQRLLVQSCLRAIGCAYQSLNLPPLADPMYRGLFHSYYGSVQPTDPNDTDTTYRGKQHSLYGYGLMGARTGDLMHSCAQVDVSPTRIPCNVHVLDHLDEIGNVYVEKNTALQLGLGRACSAISGNQVSATSQDWGVAAWNDPGFSIGIAASTPTRGCASSETMPAYIWTVDFLSDLVAVFHARGAAQVLDDGRMFTFAINADNANRLHMLTGALATASANLAQTADTLSTDPNTTIRQEMRSTIILLGGLAAAALNSSPAGPVGAAVAGAITAIGVALATYLPFAVGTSIDVFGRGMAAPNLSSAWQPGMIVLNTDGSAPTDAQLSIPDPSTLGPVRSTPNANPSVGGGVYVPPQPNPQPRPPPVSLPGFGSSINPSANVGGAGVPNFNPSPNQPSPNNGTGYVDPNGQPIGAPIANASDVPHTTTAPVATPVQSALNNPAAIAGGVTLLGALGVLLERTLGRR
jgi:hypothetical protein